MIFSLPATRLEPGMVMALPMGRTATVQTAKVGTRFVTFKTEYGESRVERNSEVLIEEPTCGFCDKPTTYGERLCNKCKRLSRRM